MTVWTIVGMICIGLMRCLWGIDVIQLLPSLPGIWMNGSCKGLKARGGFEVALRWENGKLSGATIKSLLGNSFSRIYGRIMELDIFMKKSYIAENIILL